MALIAPAEHHRRRAASPAGSRDSAATLYVLDPLRRSDSLGPTLIETERLIIGSAADCAVRLDVPGVDARHGMILRGPRQLVFKALDRRCWLNNGPVGESPLREGDRLAIGPIEFRVRRATEEELLRRLPVPEQEATGEAQTERPAAADAVLQSLAQELCGARFRTTDIPSVPTPCTKVPKSIASAATEGDELRRELRAELEKLDEQLARQRQELEALHAAAQSVQNEVGEQRQLVVHARSIAEDAHRREQHLRDIREEMTTLADELVRRERFQQRHSAALEQHEQALANVELGLAEREASLAVREQTLAAREEALTARGADVDQRREQLAAESETLSERERRLDELTAAASRRKDEAEEYATALSETLTELRQQANARPSLREVGPDQAEESSLKSIERSAEWKRRSDELTKREELLSDRECKLAAREKSVSSQSASARKSEEDQLQSLYETESELARRREALETAEHALRERVVASETDRAELERLRDDLKTERRSVTADREQLVADQSAFNERAARAEVERQVLAEERASLERQREELVAQRGSHEAQHETKKHGKKAARREAEALEDQNRRLTAENERLSKWESQLTAEQRQLEAERTALSSEQASFASERKAFADRERANIEEQERLRQESSRIEADREKLTDERTRLDEREQILAGDQSRLADDLARLAADRTAFSEERSRLDRERIAEIGNATGIDRFPAHHPAPEIDAPVISTTHSRFEPVVDKVNPPEHGDDRLNRLFQRPAAPAVSEVPTLETSSTVAGTMSSPEEENSVESYMQRLLSRVRENAPATSYEREEETSSGRRTSTKINDLTPAVPASASAGKSSPATESNVPSAELPTRPRHDSKEIRAGLNSLREVANQSARTAVAKHSSQKHRGRVAMRITLTGIVLATMLTLLFIGEFGAAAAAFGVSLLSGASTVHSWRRAKGPKPSRATSTRRKSQPSEPETSIPSEDEPQA